MHRKNDLKLFLSFSWTWMIKIKNKFVPPTEMDRCNIPAANFIKVNLAKVQEIPNALTDTYTTMK